MQTQVKTAGVAAIAVSFTVVPQLGVKLLQRNADAGSVYLGTASDVTTSTGVLIPKGNPGEVDPLIVPAEHFKGTPTDLYLIASQASQTVDVVSQ